jgi:N-acyl homoserine lactone hydrolase
MMIAPDDIRQLNLGHYTMPAGSRLAGQKIVCCAYLVRYPGGIMLFDTGLGSGHAIAEAEFSPMVRVPLQPALAAAGVRLEDVTAVANCHLHLDHCGSNPLFAGTPIFIQRAELDAMPDLDYVLPEMVDFPGVQLAVHDGDAEVAPGVRIIPTPGHTPGHQSLLLETTSGPVLLAGQAFDSASDFGRASFSLDVASAGDALEASGGSIPPWLPDLRHLDIGRVLFAHDQLAWTSAAASAQVSIRDMSG